MRSKSTRRIAAIAATCAVCGVGVGAAATASAGPPETAPCVKVVGPDPGRLVAIQVPDHAVPALEDRAGFSCVQVGPAR